MPSIRRLVVVVTVAALALFVAACSEPEPDPEDGTLNLETLQADVPAGILQAEQIPNAHVGAVEGDLHIAVAVDTDLAAAGEPQSVTIYLCHDAEVSLWITDEIVGDTGTLTRDDTVVAFSVTDEGVSGTVSLAGGEPQAFLAEPAEGDAGLYRAEENFNDVAYIGGWIVLSVGFQVGAVTVDGVVVH